MTALTLYQRQVSEQRRIRDRLLAGLGDADAIWQPGLDLPCATWHLLHAAFTNAATFLGQGDDDWSLLSAPLCAAFNIGSPVATAATLPTLGEARALVAVWDAACAARIARQGDLHRVLSAPRAGWLPDGCVTWFDAMAYMLPHEAFHHGEIALLRRLRGLPRLE